MSYLISNVSTAVVQSSDKLQSNCRIVWAVSGDLEKVRNDGKWRMNETVETCKTIYSHKPIIDCKYSQSKRFQCSNRPKMH